MMKNKHFVFSNPEPSLDDIDADPELRLLDKEPELWVHTVEREVST